MMDIETYLLPRQGAGGRLGLSIQYVTQVLAIVIFERASQHQRENHFSTAGSHTIVCLSEPQVIDSSIFKACTGDVLPAEFPNKFQFWQSDLNGSKINYFNQMGPTPHLLSSSIGIEFQGLPATVINTIRHSLSFTEKAGCPTEGSLLSHGKVKASRFALNF